VDSRARAVRLARIAAALAAASLIAAVVVFLSGGIAGVVGDNGRAPKLPLVVPPGSRFCQAGEDIPAGATSLRIWVQTATGPLDVRATTAGATITEGHAAGGPAGATIAIPVRPVRREYANATVCIRNRGTRNAHYFGDNPAAGEVTPASALAAPSDRPDPRLLSVHEQPAATEPYFPQPNGRVVVRLVWARPASTRLGFTPTLARRVALDKASFIGSWTFWLLAAVMLGLGAAAGWLVLREGAR
jgi:hypothetical protein